MSKITYIEQRTEVDQFGQFIKNQEIVKSIKIDKEENYIKVYLKHLTYLHSLPSGLDPLIYELLKLVDYKNRIVLNASIKKDIALSTKKSINTINQYISKLVKHSVILHKDTGIYVLNPYIFGKGEWKDIIELRETVGIKIEYSEDKITFTHLQPKKQQLNLFGDIENINLQDYC
jgi:hypothetical protein